MQVRESGARGLPSAKQALRGSYPACTLNTCPVDQSKVQTPAILACHWNWNCIMGQRRRKVEEAKCTLPLSVGTGETGAWTGSTSPSRRSTRRSTSQGVQPCLWSHCVLAGQEQAQACRQASAHHASMPATVTGPELSGLCLQLQLSCILLRLPILEGLRRVSLLFFLPRLS